ncbi:Panacea domain-containing protein [Frankia sp. Cas3]|uniref:Panacea domain-containing protein n=1 Tax=Frankia sp. Cas3 TaxID=3073926 RepID=UPI002AD2DC5D|nr:Panacea domain-containing protein [Frankia sp. Cas3]
MVDEYERIIAASLAAEDIPTEPDEDKFAELLLLVAEELAGDRFGGIAKVNKVLFFAEFAHVRQTGRPITGVRYQKLPHGPAPRPLRPIRDRLVASGAAEMTTETVLGREQHRLRPLRPADRSRFSDTELTAVKDAVAVLYGRTAREATDLSGEEPGWRIVDEGEDIPYATAYLAPGDQRTSPRIQARAREIADDYARQGRPAR